MATVEKIKKKKSKAGGKVGSTEVSPDQDSKTGSVISVREAQENDKADTVKELNNEDNADSRMPNENQELSGTQDRPSTSTQRPQSAQSTNRPLSADNRSVVSNKSKEAWVEQPERPGTSVSNSRPMSSVSRNSVRPMTNEEMHSGDSASQMIPMRELSAGNIPNSANTNKTPASKRPDSRVSSQLSEKESNAYVPYIYARNSVAKVVDDMKKMKNNHVRIVHEIEDTYRSIEDETQAQFNAFVLSLRTQYGTKVKTFRQVIELHRLELNQKQQYWDEALNSFGDRNQRLLKDKKTLLVQNKLEYERLEREKANAHESLTLQLDESNAALAAAKKDKDDIEEEVKVLGDDNERLRRELEALHNRPEFHGVVINETEEKTDKDEDKISVKEEKDTLHAGIVAVAAVPGKNKELERIKKELEAKEKENNTLKKDIKKILKSQAKIQKQGENEKVKRLLEVLVAEVRSIHSEVEMAVLLTEDRLSGVKEDNVVDGEDLVSAKEEYDEWAQEFSDENGKQPTAADRNSDSQGKLLYDKYTDASKKSESSDLRLTALTMISTGAVPEKLQPKQEVATTTAAAVVVPDSTGGNDLKEKIEELEEEISDLKSNNEELEETNKDQEDRIAELERLLEDAQQDTSAGVALAVIPSSAEDVEDLSNQISELQKEIDDTEASLRDEKASHDMSREELEAMKAQLIVMTTDLENQKTEAQVKLEAESSRSQAEINNLQTKLNESDKKVEALEAARLANVPVDTKQEINNLNLKIVAITKDKDSLIKDNASVESKMKELQAKLNSQEKSALTQKTASSDVEQKLKALRTEKDKELKEQQKHFEKKEKERARQEEKKVSVLEKKIRELEVAAAAASRTRATSARPKTAAGGDAKSKELQEKLREANKENKDLSNKNKQLERELKAAEKSGGGGMDDRQKKKHEKVLIEMEKRLDAAIKKVEKRDKQLAEKEDSLQNANKEVKDNAAEIARLTAELSALGVAAKEGVAAAEKVKNLEKEVKSLTKENKLLAENFNTERVLRKKYYNMVEDMKGKIRVYCRARPMSKSELDRGNVSCIKSPDEYSINIAGSRGLKEFQFDTVFMPECSQEKVFEDTGNLIQSAVDGYNVCIFAYGQTGSGKTFTIIGDKEQKLPGIAPRAFGRIFELIEENKSKFKFKVQVYMMELYNDKLIDLFGKDTNGEEKLEIKKDKKGMVFVQGAEIKPSRNAKELMALFEEGSKNRHTASTKMNADSSRSHLVVGIIIESTNKTSGQVLKGKLSLVDLAGSERAAKTGAGAEQLKEAMSINKSLSALGDVISALSSEQSFIPYRNNKLTMLMQDSLGGNAKTLMFVNISPADYNNEESTISLTYASRVKLITNDASKNADNKEISRLKSIINKMKKGEAVAEEEVE